MLAFTILGSKMCLVEQYALSFHIGANFIPESNLRRMLKTEMMLKQVEKSIWIDCEIKVIQVSCSVKLLDSNHFKILEVQLL